MSKECWQEKSGELTPCFKLAGSIPCTSSDCVVIKQMQSIEGKGIAIDSWFKRILPHSACRLSSLSKDNSEYLQRIKS